MVEYQCGVSETIQSIEANVEVRASTMMAGPANFRRRAETAGSFVALCPR